MQRCSGSWTARWALSAVACAALLGCVEPSATRTSGRHVVLIVIDTLRADFVGISGRAPFDATPRIDELARRGRWFDNAWSSAPWTPPSILSLMTSLDPPVHGLDSAADRLASRVPVFPPGAATMAEVFRTAGYRTLAVTAGGGVGSVYGFDRGFERWYEPRDRPTSDVEAGVDRALAWLAEPDPRPTFLFFHTYEVHLPNTHPPFPSPDDPQARARAAYAGDLAVADRHLGRLFDGLDASGVLDEAVIIVTADHGENLHDRVLGGRSVDHGHHLHAELLRVPLIWVAPGLIPAEGRVAEPVLLLDVLPTVCSLVGIDLADAPIQGRDLLPLLQGWGPPGPPRPFFAFAPMQGPTWGAVRTAEWTLLESPKIETEQWWGEVELPSRSLYDRDADPAERDDLASSHQVDFAELEALLADRRRDDLELRRALGGDGEIPADSLDALRALGYVDR